MPKFKKKPIVVEAEQFDGTPMSGLHIEHWAKGAVVYFKGENKGWLEVNTLEGRMTAYASEWIIKGVNGEFYPCKSDIFEKTYDPVKEKA